MARRVSRSSAGCSSFDLPSLIAVGNSVGYWYGCFGYTTLLACLKVTKGGGKERGVTIREGK